MLVCSGCQLSVLCGCLLLESLEVYGIKFKYGCCMGICNICSCDCVSGVICYLCIGDLQFELVQLVWICVSVLIIDLILDF